MITKLKIKQLEKKYRQVTKRDRKTIITRHVLRDGRYIDEDGNLLNEAELKQMEKENKELANDSDVLIVKLLSYEDPKTKHA